MIRVFGITGLVALGLSTAAAAQQPDPLARAFLVGLKACAENVQGRLPLTAPTPAQTAAGVVLAEPTGEDELKAFSDLSPRDRLFASVISNGIPEEVVVASDGSQNLCRVVVFDAPDVGSIAAAVAPLTGDWRVQRDDPLLNSSVFSGTVFGSPSLTIATRRPAKGRYGTAAYMLTLTKP